MLPNELILPLTETVFAVLLNVKPVVAPTVELSLNKTCVSKPGALKLPWTLPI